jgi:hypothetical protein
MNRRRTVIPPKRIREEFRLTYELKGAQKAVDFLSRYYGIRRMKIVVDGRSVGKRSWKACYNYETRTAYFKRKNLDRRNVMHELFHHVVFSYNLNLSKSREEREAEEYANRILKGVQNR